MSAKTVERDYVLAHTVAAVAACDHEGVLAFKGGTSLRLIHFEDYRYSADLDYSVLGGKSNAFALELVGRALAGLQEADNSLQQAVLTDSSPPRIAYVGPLGGKERTLKLDIADDELVVHTERMSLRPLWSDLPRIDVLGYSRLEVTSEKLRCILQRLQCRDLFDLYHLLQGDEAGLAQIHDLFQRKARHRGFDPALFPPRYQQRLVEFEQRWDKELSEHVPGGPPHFDATARVVTRALKRAGLV